MGDMANTIVLTEEERAELNQRAASRSGRADDARRIRDEGLEELVRITAEPHDRNVYLSCQPEVGLT